MTNMTKVSMTYLERYLIGTWSLITVLLGGVGNILVLTAVWRKCFKIDCTSLWFIVNMSIADLLYILTIVLPSVSNNFLDRWLFGPVLCGMSSNFANWYAIAHLFSLTLFSLNKLLRCMFPLRSLYNNLSKQKGAVITLVLWLVSSFPTIEYYVLKRGYQYDKSINRCFLPERDSGNELWYKIDKVNFLSYSAVPLLIIITCNIGLLHIALRSSRVVQKTTIVMIVCMSVLLLISWLPVTVYAVTNKERNYEAYKVVNYMIPIDMTLNPLMYCYFNQGFRKFVRDVFRWRCVSGKQNDVFQSKTSNSGKGEQTGTYC